jgi:RHS repeat-associated protein
LHGLVKTLSNNYYYYQDELGSTSHVASATGALLESYRYDLYGKPTYWTPLNTQLSTSNYSVRDLFTGQRWVPELGLYDDRNRFMSPDLGRFLQPDPIGFKGDGSNLYRYCGNDWANRSDPMGLQALDPGNNLFRVPDPSQRTQVDPQTQRDFNNAVGQFDAHKVDLMQNHYNTIPRLRDLGLDKAIGNMISAVRDPSTQKYFSSPNLMMIGVTKVIQAFVAQKIQIGSTALFSGNRASSNLLSNWKTNTISVNPTKPSKQLPSANAMPIELAHEGKHLASHDQGYTGPQEHAGMTFGHEMGNALRIPQRPVPNFQEIDQGYPH